MVLRARCGKVPDFPLHRLRSQSGATRTGGAEGVTRRELAMCDAKD
jgi:hypothetical protein